MHNPDYLIEKQNQFEIDKAAYERLSPGMQTASDKIAAVSFQARRGLVIGGKAIIGFLEGAFNLVFRLPYYLLTKAIGACANLAVKGVKLGVAAVVMAGRSGLATARGGLKAWEKCITYLEKKGIISKETETKQTAKIEGWRDHLLELRNDAIDWGKRTSARIDKNWNETKEKLVTMRDKGLKAVEYYGAIGLYRGSKWILNPRTPSGKPLLGWEPLNKAVGIGIAVTGFAYLSFELSRIAFLSKILHVKIAASFLTDPSSLALRMFKQATLHPLITGGVTALKFVTLPVIAATRQALKSTDFTKGVAYQYNTRLHAKDERAQARRRAREGQQASPGTKRSIRTYSRLLSMYMHKKSFSFLEKFVSHIIEAASPEFYEARIKHYDKIGYGKKPATTQAEQTAQPVQQPAPEPVAAVFTRDLEADFTQAADRTKTASPAQAPANTNTPAAPEQRRAGM